MSGMHIIEKCTRPLARKAEYWPICLCGTSSRFRRKILQICNVCFPFVILLALCAKSGTVTVDRCVRWYATSVFRTQPKAHIVVEPRWESLDSMRTKCPCNWTALLNRHYTAKYQRTAALHDLGVGIRVIGMYVTHVWCLERMKALRVWSALYKTYRVHLCWTWFVPYICLRSSVG